MRVQLHAIAAALDLPYELLTGDLSQVNFSSARVGLIEFRRRVRQIQKQVIVPQLCLPRVAVVCRRCAGLRAS